MRRYFIKGDDLRSHQVHAFTVRDMKVLRHLAFRDYQRCSSLHALFDGSFTALNLMSITAYVAQEALMLTL